MTSFREIAPHYDALMRSVPYDMWAEYYRLLLAQLDDGPHRLLDVCCGTGSVAEILSKSGFEVTGFDISAPMVEIARSKARKKKLNIVYEVSDAAELNLGEKFDAAYSFFDSINYITDPNRAAKAIERVARHLKPGGSFIFDLNTSYAFEQKMFDQRDMRRGAKVRYKWKGDYDRKSRIIRVHMEFWTGGEQFLEEHVQRAHSDAEVRQWLSAAGFESVNVYDSYTIHEPKRTSDRVHYVALLPR